MSAGAGREPGARRGVERRRRSATPRRIVDVAAANAPAPPAGDLYLLAIGVNEFPGLKDANLAYAARDAEEFARLFARQARPAFPACPRPHPLRSRPVPPDRAAIVDALDFAAEAGERDTVVVFLASHGVSDAGGDYFFVPRDARADDVAARDARERRRRIVADPLERALRCAPPGRRPPHPDRRHLSRARHRGPAPDLQSLGKRSATSALSLLLAAKGSEESQEYPPARHGLFTHALLEGLRGGADADATAS